MQNITHYCNLKYLYLIIIIIIIIMWNVQLCGIEDISKTTQIQSKQRQHNMCNLGDLEIWYSRVDQICKKLLGIYSNYLIPLSYIRVNTPTKCHPNPSKFRVPPSELKIWSNRGQNTKKMAIILATNLYTPAFSSPC